jgi:hypothetical protein
VKILKGEKKEAKGIMLNTGHLGNWRSNFFSKFPLGVFYYFVNSA